MELMVWAFPLLIIVALAYGIYIFTIGLLGLVKKRPLVFAARQQRWVMLALFGIVIIASIGMLSNILFNPSLVWADPLFIAMPLFQIAIFSLMIYIMWRQLTGYLIFGVTEETFRDALTSALHKLNFLFEETISKIKLVDIDADLSAAVQSWMGTAQIRMKQSQHAHYTKDIANAMNEYYKSNEVEANNIAFILYQLMGIVFIAFMLALVGFGLGSMFNL